MLASLDGIAVRTDVDDTTLSRNLPTRDGLLAAVMQPTVEAAQAEADALTGAVRGRRAHRGSPSPATSDAVLET